MTNDQGKSTNAGTNGYPTTNANLLLLGVGVGAAAIGVAVALTSRRKHDRWYAAKQVTKRVAGRSGDLAAASKDIVDRVRIIYNESRKVVEEATELWSRGRKLAGV